MRPHPLTRRSWLRHTGFLTTAALIGFRAKAHTAPATRVAEIRTISLQPSYPGTVELADGTSLSVWYERLNDSPRAVLHQARWRTER